MNAARKLPQGMAIATQSAEFWRRLAPELTISDVMTSRVIVRSENDAAHDRKRLTNDGYVHLKQPGITAPLDKIARSMDRIVEAGLPAAFIGVYDEVWSVAAQLQGVLGDLFAADAHMLPNFWASFAGKGDVGVRAQRNRPGMSLNSDHSPKSLSLWVPLTNATPDNGCLYVVPADQDKAYAANNSGRADSSLHGIKALPAQSGDVIALSGEIYHWRTGVSPDNQDGPLMSLTWEFQSAGVNGPQNEIVGSYPFVPFEDRLGLLAHQMPLHTMDIPQTPVWQAVQQTLANRFPMGAPMPHI